MAYKDPPKDTQFGGKRANRRNTHGRPKSFAVLRKLAQRVASEDVETKKGTLSRIELMMLAMSSSKNPADRRLFLEYAFGKVKDELDLNQDGKLKVIVEYSNADTADDARGTTEDKGRKKKA